VSPVLARFWQLIDSESVRLYQAVMYTCYFAAGVYMASFGRAPSTVQQAMGTHAHYVWIALMVCCPLLVLLGARVSNKWAGLWLQLGGNVGVGSALAAYVAAVLQSPWWGTGAFAVWGYVGLTICTGAIILRDGRRILQVRILAKEMSR
jgi:hypothetical protein